ncbi:MAG: YfiR/HmsC family protein [bacterium]
MAVPIEYQAELIPKIIHMNKNFNLAGDTIRLGILYNSYFRLSLETSDGLLDFLKEYKKEKNQISIKVIAFDMANIPVVKLKSHLIRNRISVIYITPLRNIDFGVISEICKARKIFSISADPQLSERHFTLSFDLINGKIKIIINLNSAKDEDVDLSSYLLKVARISDE